MALVIQKHILVETQGKEIYVLGAGIFFLAIAFVDLFFPGRIMPFLAALGGGLVCLFLYQVIRESVDNKDMDKDNNMDRVEVLQ